MYARANTHFELGNGLVQRVGKRQQHLHVPAKTSERHNKLKLKWVMGWCEGRGLTPLHKGELRAVCIRVRFHRRSRACTLLLPR